MGNAKRQMLTIERLKEVKTELDAMPEPFYRCRGCGQEYLVFGEVLNGSYVICERCSLNGQ